MLNLGFQEILLILLLTLVVVGPDRLPELLRFMGRQYGKLTRASNELRRAFMLEAERSDIEKRADAMRKRREEARKRIAEQRLQREQSDRPDPEIAPMGQTDSPFRPAPPSPPEESPENPPTDTEPSSQ